LKADERTTVSSHVRSIEISSQGGSVRSLRVSVDKVDVVKCKSREIILLRIDDRRLLILAQISQSATGKFYAHSVLGIIVCKVSCTPECDFALTGYRELLDVSSSTNTDGIVFPIVWYSTNG
jgi:hypothetical protein